MTRYLTRDRAAIAAALVAPLAAAAILLPFRASWPNTNVALLLVVVVVAVAAVGKRATDEIKMNGTPTFVIDGKVYGGELSLDQFKAILDPLIKK